MPPRWTSDEPQESANARAPPRLAAQRKMELIRLILDLLTSLLHLVADILGPFLDLLTSFIRPFLALVGRLINPVLDFVSRVRHGRTPSENQHRFCSKRHEIDGQVLYQIVRLSRSGHGWARGCS